MTLLYTHPTFREHRTGAHPESPRRLERIEARLADLGLTERCQRPEWSPATDDQLLRNHTQAHLEAVKSAVAQSGGFLDADTVVSERSEEAARLAAGAVCDAVRRVGQGEAKNALCLVRPPGHHAVEHRAMGFCLYNNVAIAARAALVELPMDRVLVIDWDVHHGNGTQDSFWSDGRVGFFSIHRFPFYPGTGDADETGSGPGLGLIRNAPMAFGTSRADFKARFERDAADLAARVKPELILLSAGFDAHREDPIGSLGLETEDFADLTTIVRQLAEEHCQGKLVSTLEGGYHVDRLADSVALHLEGLLIGDC
jgi:acetoin utilization deacetylase AcuC-like enzyme